MSHSLFFCAPNPLPLTNQNQRVNSSSPATAVPFRNTSSRRQRTVVCKHADDNGTGLAVTYSSQSSDSSDSGMQTYSQIERLITETAKQNQGSQGTSRDWVEIEGAWVLKPQNIKPTSVIHFIGGAFVGAAPQLTYRFFLEKLSEKGVIVVATPFASGFDHFLIADEVQFKFDRCIRSLHDTVNNLPIFGVGHSLGSVIHLLIGSRYAVQRRGNVLMSFNNKEPSLTIPLFSPVIVPMAQSFGPILSQLMSSQTILQGAEMAVKQLENVSPPIMKQVLPLVEQLPPLYMDLVKGREEFTPKPDETRRLVKSYYGVSTNLLIKFKDDLIDETSVLAQLLSVESTMSSSLDMSIRTIPGNHGLPLQQVVPDVPPAVADTVNQVSDIFANLTMGTPLESVAKEVKSTFSTDTMYTRAQNSKNIDMLVDVISTWVSSHSNII